jgi:DNA-binding CsgD family transcriptional regulator
MFTLWRSRQQSDYDPGDMARAAILAPHLMLAIHNVATISKINSWGKKLPADETNDGLLLLDHKFRPVYSNVKAREICLYLFNTMPHDTINIEKREFPVPSCILKDCAEILDMVKSGTQLVSWPKDRVIFSESGKQFRSACSLVWKADKMHSTPNFMVTLTDLTGKNSLEDNLQNKYRLSRREMDIIFCMVSDLSYGETAEKLYISKLTVHTHVKNIYRKLNVKNKIELYRRIQSLDWLT